MKTDKLTMSDSVYSNSWFSSEVNFKKLYAILQPYT